MPTKTTQHYRDGKHYEQRDTTRSDGSRRIVESEVHDMPFGGRFGSDIVRETNIDKNGNSTTKTK